ncbi:calcium-binding protein [Mesorhizobium sp. M0898]|uniref:calcium-binding protein n=1 Tax=Mesorhizobium sp. M0898 TaxID=2957020 RepID=UPI00333A74E1
MYGDTPGVPSGAVPTPSPRPETRVMTPHISVAGYEDPSTPDRPYLYVKEVDPVLGTVWAPLYQVDPTVHYFNLTPYYTSNASPGGSDHTSSGSSPFGNGGLISTPVGDHAGHPNGVSGNKDNGWNGKPVLLDLSGNGLSINPLSSSSQFLDLDGDGYQHRTAWADVGTGVLVLDADGDGKISRSSEFVFTEWDQTATSDLEALKSVFDTNHNGLLDAGDERWSEFKVMIDGQLVSLASLGIASIGLTPTGTGQSFTDGSAITGTAQFTRTDGTTGTVGDAVLTADANGYIIKSTTVTNGDGSKTTDLAGYGKDGTLAFQNRITISADGLSTTTQFDDDGNGTYERSQSDVTTITAGVRKRVVSDFNTDGSLADRSTTTSSADKTTVTTTLDEDGDGAVDQTQVFVRNADGSTTTTVSESSVNGTLLDKMVTTASANGLSKTVQVDSTGSGVYDLTSTETTVVAGDGTRTKTVANTSSGGSLIGKEQTVTSADGRTRTVSHDLDGNGTYETRDVTTITDGANDVSVTTVSTYSSTNALIGKSVVTTSDDGLAKTASTDLDGDGLFDVISSDVTVVGAGGSLTETQQLKSRDGSLLGSSTTDTSADRKTISISTDGDGDGRTDAVKTIVIDGAGVTTTTGILYNPDGSIVGKTFDQTSANGLSVTSKADLNSDGVYDVIVTDVTTTDASSNRTRTVTTTSASGALIGSSAITTSADSLTQTVKDDVNADGTVDRTTVQATVLGSDGSRTVTTTTTSTSGAMLAKTEARTSADRKTTTTTIDANGDTKIDRTQVAVVNADGSQVVTVSDTDINGTLHAKSETTLSANGLTRTNKQDVNGDGIYDVTTQAVTVIAATGVRTTTTSQTSSNGTLLSKTIAAVSANGLTMDAQYDADGDGVIEAKSSDVTVLNADGSTTRTVSTLAGTGALVGKTIATTSANGLTSTLQADIDGNGTIDQTTTATTVLAADGSKTATITIKNGSNAQIARTQTVASSDGHNVTTTNDLDGNGTTDENVTTVLNSDGTTTETASTYGAGGALTSKATHTVSANGLSETLATDLDGNGTIDQSTTDVVVLNADGSKTETITDLDAAGAVKDKTTIVTSANGLTKTVTWAAVGTTTSRSMTDTTVLNANGSTTETVAYRKSNGSLESQTVTTVSADKLTSTTTRDVDGNGSVDITTTSVKNADGSVTSTMSGANSEDWSSVSTTTKTTTVSADGLHSVTLYGPTSIKKMPTMTAKTTSDTTIGADGSTVTIVKDYQLTTTATPTLFLADQTRITKAGDGFSTTKEWDVNGDGSYDSKETDVTVLNANGSTVRTISKFEGAVLKSTFVTTTSANGLSTTTNWDVFGTDPFSQDTTDVTTINADGSSTRTLTNLKADGSQLSKFVTVTSADGRTTTTQEDIDGAVGFDRTTSDNVLTLADGAIVETIKRSTTGGVLLDSATATTSGDRRIISIVRDVDGDGTVDQTEVTTRAVDGSVKTVITDFSAANHKSAEVTITTSADGLSTTSEWDFDGDGTVDQRRTTTKADLGDGSIETQARDKYVAVSQLGFPSESFAGAWNTVTSDDGRTIYTATDIDNGGFDNIRAAIIAADGSVTESFHNGYHSGTLLIPGLVYWKNVVTDNGILNTGANGLLAENVIVKTSADGLTTTTYFDFDGNATDPTSNPTSNPSTTNFEVVAVTQAQIDGSVVTTFTEKNDSGVVVAKGTMTTSADGMTTTLLKDADNNGTYEHTETAVTRIDGSIRKVVTDYDASGVATKTVTTDVSADGKSTSVVMVKDATGTGTTTGVGVEFIATGTTNDTISGSTGDDHIQGGAGVDKINGGAGDDVIDGGTGADELTGSTGNDTYIVDNAADQVSEDPNVVGGSSGTDTVLSSVTYTISDVNVENLTLTGASAINATGNSSDNVLTGNSAANSLSGGSGSDGLYGGAGNDSLTGGKGSDTLVGGIGNDYLNGQDDGDIYVFQRGDGSDTLEDIVSVTTTASADINAAQALGVSANGTVNTWVGGYLWQTSTNSLLKLTDGGKDSLTLTGGITADNLSFAWAGVGQDNLVVSIAGGPVGDSITINQQALAAAKIEKLTIDGWGTMLFGVASAPGATLNGTSAAEILFGVSGDETITGNGGIDFLFGGAGNDAIYGGSSTDTFYGGAGNDTLNGAAGDDRYVFRRGDGTDGVKDFNIVTTTAGADITAAQAKGVSATGIVNTWVGGYYWNTSINGLQKATEGNVDTLALESGIKAEDLSFSWTGVGGDNLAITIADGPAGDSIVLYQQTTAAAKIEKLALDGLGTLNLFVATAPGAMVTGSTTADIIFGLAGNEALNSSDGDDVIFGGAGNDTMNGGIGNDAIYGGAGSDYSNGAAGDDRFVYRRGDGSDAIDDNTSIVTTASADINAATAKGVYAGGTVNTWVGGYYWQTSTNQLLKRQEAGTDTLALEGISANDLSFSWTGAGNDNLLINIAGGPVGDSMLLYQQSVAGHIEKLTLDGMGTMNLAVATAAGGTVNGSVDADIIFGLSGNEVLNGNAGNDALYGGAGNDTLSGGTGNDSYHFNAGGGADTIVESGTYNDSDELDFGTGLDANELWFSQQGNDLVISVLGTTDKVTVSNWFAGPGNVVETIKSGDGKVLNHSEVATLVAAMAGFQPATSPGGTGIQPGDPRLGDPAQIGTIAAAVQSSWATA